MEFNHYYSLEQYFLTIYSVTLLLLYLYQIKNDVIINRTIDMQNAHGTIIINKTEPIGESRKWLHYTGFLVAILMVIRVLDPVPVLGFYHYGFVDIISKSCTAILLIGSMQATRCILETSAELFTYQDVIPTRVIIHLISVILLLSAIICSLVQTFGTSVAFWSDGIYLFICFLVTSIFISSFGVAVKKVTTGLEPALNLTSTTNMTNYERIVKVIRRLKYTFVGALSLCVVIWIVQVYLLINISKFRNRSSPSSDDFSNYNNFFWIQCVGSSIMFKFSYLEPTRFGKAKPLSEIFNSVQESSVANIDPRGPFVSVLGRPVPMESVVWVAE